MTVIVSQCLLLRPTSTDQPIKMQQKMEYWSTWHGAKNEYYLPQAPFTKLARKVGLFSLAITTCSPLSLPLFYFSTHKKHNDDMLYFYTNFRSSLQFNMCHQRIVFLEPVWFVMMNDLDDFWQAHTAILNHQVIYLQ